MLLRQNAEDVARLSNLFLNKVPAWRISTLLKQKLTHMCFLWLFRILKTTFFVNFCYFISCFFNPNETCVWFISLFISKFFLIRLFFFQLRLPLLLNMQKQSKKLWKSRELRDKENRKKKKRINSEKSICKGSFIYDVRKMSNVRTCTSLFPSSHKHLDLSRSHSWTSLIRIQSPPQFNFAQLFLC